MTAVKKVGFRTLGCKLNFSETSTIARAFEQGGFVRAKQGESADIYVINSCSVTEHADKKCRNLVRRLVRENPQALVVVTGCYAQLKPREVAAIPGVDLVVGNNEKGSIPEQVAALAAARANGQERAGAVIHTCEVEALTEFFAAFSSGDRTRSFLKVQDGCSYRCSYCTIPLARGASRNIPVANLVEEARQIAQRGQKEIVLTGINIGDLGRTTGESFLSLLEALDAVEGIERYRISSIEPNLLTDPIIEFTARSRKFQPHFHVPLQSGCDRILGLMRRRYTTARFADRIAAVRRAMPDVFFGIDVIVGFPGETETDFEQTYRFLETIQPAFLHIFPYSVRPHTPAAEMPDQVDPRVSAERVKRLGELSDRLHRAFCEAHVGREAHVLWESTRHGSDMLGYTENYLRVRTPFQRERINTVSRVRLGEVGPDNVLQADILDA